MKILNEIWFKEVFIDVMGHAHWSNEFLASCNWLEIKSYIKKMKPTLEEQIQAHPSLFLLANARKKESGDERTIPEVQEDIVAELTASGTIYVVDQRYRHVEYCPECEVSDNPRIMAGFYKIVNPSRGQELIVSPLDLHYFEKHPDKQRSTSAQEVRDILTGS